MAALQAEATQNDTVEMEYGWVADRAEVEAAVPVLVLERLPEGSEAVLGKEVFWSEQENGEKSCFVTAEQGEQLLMLAREQNLHIRENGAWNPTHTVWEICVTAE